MKKIVLLVIALFVVSNFSANGFSVDLIHRDSPLSPFYNSLMNQTEILKEAALRSIARANNFSDYFTTLNESNAETVMIPNGGDYLMKIFIGTPPQESIVVADTGSGLVWVQCWPCIDCYKQVPPLFNPTKSYTYRELSCHSDDCKTFFTFCGQPAEECKYKYQYKESTHTIGDLAKDVIGFGSNAPFETIFGCGLQNKGRLSGFETGVAGLSASKLSLVMQLGIVNGRVFSYCMNPPYSKKPSKLTFQPRPTLVGQPGAVSTLMVVPIFQSELYFLRVEGISINEVRISLGLLESFNMLIDSGSALTYLQTKFYEVVETAVVHSIHDLAMRFPPRPFRLCYKGATIKEVPDVTFHFSGRADVRFPASNMFWNVDGATICFIVLPHPKESILGNRAQVNFKVEYDLDGRRVSFAPTDCTKE